MDAWELQFTISESHAVRLVGQDIQVFIPADWSKGVVDKLKVEGVKNITLSPGLNPSLAVFVAEKNVCDEYMPFMPTSWLTANVSGSTSQYQDLQPLESIQPTNMPESNFPR